MNAQAILQNYRSLVEAGRRGKISSVDSRPFLASWWDMPVFSMNIDQMGPGPYESLPLPFPRFVIAAVVHQPGDGLVDTVTAYEGTDSSSFTAWQFNRFRSNSSRWKLAYQLVVRDEVPVAFDQHPESAQGFDPRYLASVDGRIITSLVSALDAPNIAQVTTSTATYSGPRSPGGFRLSHPVRVIDITKVRQQSSPPAATGTGSSVAPHWRRGHWRTYKATGKRVWVRSAAIHGGTPSGQTQLYKMRK